MSSLALQLIAECKKNKSTFLDLGNCGLTEVPEELYELTWLENLNLGTNFYKGFERAYSRNSLNQNRLSVIPKKLDVFEKLQSLYLDSNDIRRIEGLEKVFSLKSLSLCNNRITKIEGLLNLSGLIKLDLSGNKISKVEGLENLSNLRELILFENKISHLENLSSLKSLDRLVLYGNKILQIQGLEELFKLTHLDLSDNEIGKIEGLSNLKLLKYLDISVNQISKIEGLEQNTELKSLLLAYNQISKIEGVGQLAKLSWLKLGSNQISNEGLSYEAFESVDKENLTLKLYGNPITVIDISEPGNHWPALKSYFLQQKDGNLIPFTFPKKILLLGNHQAGKSSLLEYLSTGKITSKRSTHILKIEDYYFESKAKHKKEVPDAVFFDFGGQDFYHGLYQVFLSSQSLHLMLWQPGTENIQILPDSENRSNYQFPLSYWMGQKRYLEEKSNQEVDDLLIVRTHIDQVAPASHEINSDFKLCLLEDAQWKDGSEKLISQTIAQVGRKFFKASLHDLIEKTAKKDEKAQWYIDFIAYVYGYATKTPEKPVALEAIREEYQRPQIGDEDIDELFRADLHQIHLSGILLYYPDIPELSTVAWLDPQGLVEYVHKKILQKKYVANGILDSKALRKESDELICLLKEQKVIFQDPYDSRYILPNYLPLADKNDPDYQLFVFGLEKPDFVIQFKDFIPFGLINQMICHFGQNPDQKKYWRNQLLFTLDKQVRVLIKLDLEKLRIAVYTQRLEIANQLTEKQIHRYLFLTIMAMYWGKKPINLAGILYDEYTTKFIDGKTFHLEKQLTDKSKLKVGDELDFDLFVSDLYEKGSIEKMFTNEKKESWSYTSTVIKSMNLFEKLSNISISVDDQFFVSYQDLTAEENQEQRTIRGYTLDEKLEPIATQYIEYSKSQFNAFMEKEVKAPKKIFISYSKKDTTYLNELLPHLAKMEKEGLIEVWFDRKIAPGEWDPQIKQQLDAADIVISLISQNFFDSGYIWENELKVSLERRKTDNIHVIPVLIRDCDWEHWVGNVDEESLRKPTGTINQLQFYPYFDYLNRNQELQPKLRAVATWPAGEEPFVQVIRDIRKLILQ